MVPVRRNEDMVSSATSPNTGGWAVVGDFSTRVLGALYGVAVTT